MVKITGRLVNLDWKKEPMELGHPLRIRFDEKMAPRLIEVAGFTVETIKDSRPYHYLVIAKPYCPRDKSTSRIAPANPNLLAVFLLECRARWSKLC